jgi:hypothetical protein
MADISPEALYTVSALTSFVSVFLKGFQHMNVIGKHYKLTFFTSYAMAAFDVISVGLIVQGGWSIAFSAGTGTAFGMILSMFVHSRLVKPKE